METTKRIHKSKCCDSDTKFCPPSFGDKGMYFCDVCHTECDVEYKTIQIFEKISNGHYRPIKH